MTLRFLLGSLALSTCLTAQALTTEDLPESTLHVLGAALAQNAGSSQWQQLWQRTRNGGHLAPGSTAWFSLPHPQIVERVKATLADADSVTAEHGTRARYRRDFQPEVVGRHNGTALSAVCLWVDWRGTPQQTSLPTPGQMGLVSLLVSHPCP